MFFDPICILVKFDSLKELVLSVGIITFSSFANFSSHAVFLSIVFVLFC